MSGVARPESDNVERAHQTLLDRTRRLEFDVVEWAEAALRCQALKVYQVKGHATFLEYLEATTGWKYRTVRRYLSIGEGIGRLPEDQQPAAKAGLASLGSHKAAMVASVIGHPAVNWDAEVARAEVSTPEAYQERVNTFLGVSSRSQGERTPSEKFLHWIESNLAPDAWEEVHEGYRLYGTLVGEATPDSRAFVLDAIREVLPEWRERAQRVRKEGRRGE